MILPLTSGSLHIRINECLCIVLCPPSCKWQYQIGVSGGMAEQIVSGRHRRYVYKHIRLVAVNSNASAFVIHACVNLLPARAKSPLHKRSLCNGCISLSNAEGFRKKGLSPINAQIMPAKTVVMIAKNDGTFPFVMAKNAITSPKMMPL